MKRFVTIGLGLLAVIGLSLSVATQANAVWTVDIPTDLEAERLDPVDFDITIDDATGLESLDITLTYDTGVLQYVDTALGTVWDGDSSPTLLVNSGTPGTLVVGAYPYSTLAPNPVGGTLIEFDFQVLGGAPLETTYIPFTEFLINESDTPDGVENGAIDIVPEPSTLLLLGPAVLVLPWYLRRRRRTITTA